MSSNAGPNQNEDFKMFLEDVNDDLFDHQLDIPKNESNIRKVRQKTLKRIEKEIKKKNNGVEGDERKGSVFGVAKKEAFCDKLKSVISNRVFLAIMVSLTGLYYVVTGI